MGAADTGGGPGSGVIVLEAIVGARVGGEDGLDDWLTVVVMGDTGGGLGGGVIVLEAIVGARVGGEDGLDGWLTVVVVVSANIDPGEGVLVLDIGDEIGDGGMVLAITQGLLETKTKISVMTTRLTIIHVISSPMLREEVQ